ncbi:uncharacterized protein J7T54_000446 [Emericellopsis cladophorae]|uniref:Uncharacterized protein n=1 Tax=Emericellopsis cladophorae TaxID=2686198 RepID=A0A9P9XX99_9HYPO|nr:uncharacterized protein J7T54_000446 [Emericellopsis cladophorae]KAI6779348.1 hypothetical protein J7T54_000446 [Emericellopsis cladophorae]
MTPTDKDKSDTPIEQYESFTASLDSDLLDSLRESTTVDPCQPSSSNNNSSSSSTNNRNIPTHLGHPN